MSVEEEPHKVLGSLKFGILSPHEIRRLSVAEVQTADTYDEDGAPISSGLMDGRLGTLEPRQRCRTCGNTAARCPGHFGHIELAVPVIHVEFSKLIYLLIGSTCRNCGRLLLTSEKAAEYNRRIDETRAMLGIVPDDLYKEIGKEAKKRPDCSFCGAKQYKLTFSKPTSYHEVLDEGARKLTPSMVRERLERMTDDDLRLLGLEPAVARPEWMVLQVLPVPPVYVRPSITLESGIRSEDDLTHKLVDIIRINQRLKENIEAGAPTLIIQDLSELLQYHVTTYFNNESSGIPPARHRSGRALKTLSQRLKGKEGRFRSNLSGKRVDFSARTVISPDPNLDINEVGVPIDVAKRLTIPEKITSWNLEALKNVVRNGPDVYPGALYVVRPDQKRIRLEFVTDREKVAEGLSPAFVVERHLNDGDIAIFNRQPSLHRMSIMAHRVRVLPYKTFRLHLCVCPPYNADFDGDEMNLHVPQSEEAQTEARLLMRVQDQILSPRYGGPIIGAIRDFISAGYLLTSSGTLLGKEAVCYLTTAAGYEGELPEPEDTVNGHPMWTGKQIFSLFLPKSLSYVLKASVCQQCHKCSYEKCPYDAYVVVKDGELIRGVIDKNSIGAERSESLYHRIVKDYGTEIGRKFLNSICKLLTAFITVKGFTFALDELDLSKKAEDRIHAIIRESESKVNDLIHEKDRGTLQRLQGRTIEESLEIYIMNELAKARDKAGDTADQYFGMDNHGIIMTRTGARGSNLNIGQMTACVGQQSVRGKRIVREYYDRALSHFVHGDSSPEARGFVNKSYRDGLSPAEFFFHAMGGREGLVDTAVRTQQSGYMQRRLINALEYLRVEYDGTVRDARGDIIQFLYGEDGADPAKSDHGKAVNVVRLVERIKIADTAGPAASKEFAEGLLKEVSDELTPLQVRQLRRSVIEAELNQSVAKKAVAAAVDGYKRALVEPGEAVGIVAAQSIGEPGTQMTLRTFHYAGVKERNVTLGLPRLIEIVDARRLPSTPTMTIYLDTDHRASRERAMEVARSIYFTNVENVAKTIYIDPRLASVVIKLDEEMMEDRGVTNEDLERALHLPHCELPKVEEGIVAITPKEAGQNVLRRVHDRVASVHLKGVPGIDRIQLVEERGEWTIQTDGTNLPRILRAPGVDPTRTFTNHIHEVARTLGIEAARNAIIKEAMGVLEEQGLDVDVRHVMLVADVMTATGEIRQIGRHGVSGEKAGVLARAAFEITVPTLVEAAARGQSDTLKGVSENVIIGQSIPVGTGLIELYMGRPQGEQGSVVKASEEASEKKE